MPEFNLEYDEVADEITIHFDWEFQDFHLTLPRSDLLRQIVDLICQGMPAVFEADGELWQTTALSPPDDECVLDESQTILEDHWGETE